MDIEHELLAVLSNPSDVWDAVLTGLEPASRTTLLVFTTCSTPVSLVDWQTAVGRISPELSAVFEESLRKLDDMFISTTKESNGDIVAGFRNPSMDDFCAVHLDKNVGTAKAVAEREPGIGQVLRLLQLGSAQRLGQYTHRNLHRVLIKSPFVLLDRLVTFYVDHPRSRSRAALAIATLLGHSNELTDEQLKRTRAALADYLDSLSFDDTDDIRSLLGSKAGARGLRRLLGRDFGRVYERIWKSAYWLGDFDSLVSLEESLDIEGNEAPWQSLFQQGLERWFENVDDLPDAYQERDYYNRVAEHLDINDLRHSARWDEVVEDFERKASHYESDDGDEWRDDERSDPIEDEIDGLFEGLVEADRPTEIL